MIQYYNVTPIQRMLITMCKSVLRKVDSDYVFTNKRALPIVFLSVHSRSLKNVVAPMRLHFSIENGKMKELQ